VTWTDRESRIMPSGSGFETDYMPRQRWITLHAYRGGLYQPSTMKAGTEPALRPYRCTAKGLGVVAALIADSGYSAKRMYKLRSETVAPYIAPGREGHNHSL